MPNLDEFIQQAEQDDLEDMEWITPVNYAKLRNIYPQRVYGALRDHKLASKHCDCGRKVINKADADALFKKGAGHDE